MKIFAINIFNYNSSLRNYFLIAQAFKKCTLGEFFNWNSFKELVTEISKIIIQRINNIVPQAVNQFKYTYHAFKHESGLVAVIVTDLLYPVDTTFKLLGHILTNFMTNFTNYSDIKLIVSYPLLDDLIYKYMLIDLPTIIQFNKMMINDILLKDEIFTNLILNSTHISNNTKKYFKKSQLNKYCII